MRKMVYGPVPSRRLGISLGVDIVSFKTCSYDCIYCQLGKTTDHAVDRKSFVPIDSVLKQIKEVVDQNSDMDYITFSGSGEPTLNRDIGEMIRRIKEFTVIPVAVLTNGSLLWQKQVQKDISPADLVVPSIDAVSEEVFQKVNRPVEGLSMKRILGGIKEFCEGFKGKVFLEIMLVKGLNDSEKEIRKINEFVRELKAEKVQLNTVVRPPADSSARPVEKIRLAQIKSNFDPRLMVEVVEGFDRATSKAYHKDLEKAITELLKRRPTRKDEMATSLGVHPNEILKYLQVLEEKQKIRRVKTTDDSETYFAIA
jgi:wyosine [tRNA(Phe)-imidazoG37] synthetase (radical SAM superfamily)